MHEGPEVALAELRDKLHGIMWYLRQRNSTIVNIIIGVAVPNSHGGDLFSCDTAKADRDENNEKEKLKIWNGPSQYGSAAFNKTMYPWVEEANKQCLYKFDHAHSVSELPGYVEGLAILVVVFTVSFVSAFNDWQKDRQFRSLNGVKNNRKVKVVRGGHATQVSIYDINVGEVVILDTGDQVPADGVFIEGFNLETDESAMTGESDMIKKNKNKPFLLSGCQVASGVGRMLIIAVGENSEWGMTMSRLAEDDDSLTPLQARLVDLAKLIGNVGVAVSVITFIALIVIWGAAYAQCTDVEEQWKRSQANLILSYFIMAITIIVVAVPEGLPLAVTIALAYSMKRMMIDNNLVRHLDACETMGGATNICSDKTGTLTENRMTVVKCFFNGRFYENVPPAEEFSPAVLKVITDGVANNSKAYLNNLPNGVVEFVGSKTECALLMMIRKFGYDYDEIRKSSTVRSLYAFSSEKKRMSVIVKKADGGFRLYCKGASEIVLDLCTHVLDKAGVPTQMSEGDRKALGDLIVNMASQGLRTLCLSYKDLPTDDPEWDNAAPDNQMVCIGLVGIKDPVRQEVPAAVAECHTAGIMVRMVTGDNILTAKHIARECGILTNDGLAMEGPDFRKLSPEEMDAILPKLQVLARSSPNDKFVLVNRLRTLGEVVAVTGDGTNDAPALKEADVGLAMGISGTEVAKEAADVILMDDNFTSIVKAVMWGRCVYDNIRKFVQFQLTVNVCALTVAFISAVTGKGRPLKPIQLLWVNLIMDTLGALALGTEKPTPLLLKRKPYGRFEPLISREMWKHILGQALYQVTVQFVLLYAGSSLFKHDICAHCVHKYTIPAECVCALPAVIPGAPTPTPTPLPYAKWDVAPLALEHPTAFKELQNVNFCYEVKTIPKDPFVTEELLNTLIFNSFVFQQIFNEINCRKLAPSEWNVFKGIHTNPLFPIIILVIGGIQVITIEAAYQAFSVMRLPWHLWLLCVALGAGCLPWSIMLRLIYIPPKVHKASAMMLGGEGSAGPHAPAHNPEGKAPPKDDGATVVKASGAHVAGSEVVSVSEA